MEEADVVQYLQIASYVVAVAASIAALTPADWDNRLVKTVRQIVDILALNVGNAKNKE